MQFSSVVFPAPLGPSSATISPARTVRVTPASTRNDPVRGFQPARSQARGRPRRAAEVDLDDGGIGGHGGRRAFRDLFARAEDHEPAGKAP